MSNQWAIGASFKVREINEIRFKCFCITKIIDTKPVHLNGQVYRKKFKKTVKNVCFMLMR